MVKVLFVSMPDVMPGWEEGHITTPSLAGSTLAGNINRKKHRVYVADLVLKRKNVARAVDEAMRIANPDVVGLSTMTFQFPTAVKIARHIKNQNPNLPIWLGGYHPTCLREAVETYKEFNGSLDEALSGEEWKDFSAVFYGEAERSFSQALDALENRESFEGVLGISFRDKGIWQHNKRHKALSVERELLSLSPPDIDSRIWTGTHFNGKKPFETIEASRGCIYNCTFCSIRAMQPGGTYVAHDIQKTLQYIKELKKRGVKSIFFNDDNMFLNPEFATELHKGIIREGLNDISYSGFTSTKHMAEHPVLVELMRKAGWWFAFLAVETTSEKTLRSMKKASNVDLAARAIENLHKAGIVILAGLVTGTQTDTEESIRENFRWCAQYPVDAVIPNFIMPHLGTQLRADMIKKGLLLNRGGIEEGGYGGWKTYNGAFAHAKTESGLMPREIEKIVWEELKTFKNKRRKNILMGKLNYLRNNPRHALVIVKEGCSNFSRSFFKERNLSEDEKFERYRQRRLATNNFNI